MKRWIKSSTGFQKYRYKFEKPSLRNYYFSGELDEDRGRVKGQITKLAPYDDAEYYWAKIEENGLVKFIYDGKVKDKMQMDYYDEENFENVNEYFDYFLESVADELKNFNRGIEPRMMYD